MTLTFDAQLLKTMALFENVTHAKLKDCIPEPVHNALTFVVQPGESAKAIGRNGAVVRRLEQMFRKRIRIVEFAAERVNFIRNLILPLQAKDILEEGDIVTITGPNTQTKGLLIGRNGQNLRALEEKVRRHFPVAEIKVV